MQVPCRAAQPHEVPSAPSPPAFCARRRAGGLARAPRAYKPKKERPHENAMVGWTSKKHTARTRVAAHFAALGTVPLTAANLSAIGPYASTTAADADLSGLLHALRNYWAENGIGEGAYPEDAVLQLGSKVKLWAPGTHVDIGYAVGHPNLDGRAR